jgi:hypothetical protein
MFRKSFADSMSLGQIPLEANGIYRICSYASLCYGQIGKDEDEIIPKVSTYNGA